MVSLSVFQDQRGFIWVGTQEGVDKFDGYTFKHYQHDVNNPFSRPYGWVTSISEDKDGNILTGDILGNFSVLNRVEDKWATYSNPFLDSIIARDKVDRNNVGAILSIDVHAKRDRIWMGTFRAGLLRFDPQTKSITHYRVHPDSLKEYGNHEIINKVVAFDENRLMVATNVGIQLFDVRTLTFEKLVRNADPLYNSMVLDFNLSRDRKNLFVATRIGAYRLHIPSGEVESFINNKKLSDTLSARRIESIHWDDQHNWLWLLTSNTGIDVIDLGNYHVTHFNPSKDHDIGVNEATYVRLYQDLDKNMWVCSNASGIMKYDPGKKKFGLLAKSYPRNSGLGFVNTWGAMIDDLGHVWVGNAEPNGGISEYDPVKNEMKKHLVQSDHPPVQRIWLPVQDYKKNIIVLARTQGLTESYIKYKSKNSFEPVPSSEGLQKISINITNLYLNATHELLALDRSIIRISDSNGVLQFNELAKPTGFKGDFRGVARKSPSETYVFNKSGVWLWNEPKNEAHLITKGLNFGDDQLTQLTAMAVLNDKYAYIATYGNGIITINLENSETKFITLKDGIASQYLYSIYKDKSNRLWMSSNFGIIRYEPATNTFRTYTTADGTQNFEYNSSCSMQTEEGVIVMGGITGVNYFDPNKLGDNTAPPRVLIQALHKRKKQVLIDASSSKGFYEVEHADNNLSFDFVALNYRNSASNQYKYKMEGYDEDWVDGGHRRFANYTNLPEGNYKFRVIAANNDGTWNMAGASIDLKILPPIYRTIWAYLLYAFLAIALIYFFTRHRTKLQIKKMENERKNSELTAARDLQSRMLPKHLPVSDHFEVAAFLRTSSEVGGDYYDFFPQNDGSMFVVCGDATGHGTAAGMLVSITKAGLTGLPTMEPDDMLKELNRIVKKVDLGILRMSLNIAHINGNILKLSSAGMPPFYIYRSASKQTEEILNPGLPLGSFHVTTYEKTTTHLEKNDVLVMLSDGMPEAPNREGVMYNYDKLLDAITRYGKETPEKIIEKLMEEADMWLEGNRNPDDITLLVFKKKQ